MSFQFQSVAALSPFIVQEYAATLVDIGLLIGLYLAPGIVISIPGGAIAARFGDKNVVVLSMILMLIGGLLTIFAPSWEWVLIARLVAGTGGVIVSVVMTKMLVDWFVGREISTAMAIFINSWPVGIALALLTLPAIGEIGGLGLARSVVLSVVAVGLVTFILAYRAPENAPPPNAGLKVEKFPLPTLLLSSFTWGCYNIALIMIISFGSGVLNQQGWTFATAGMVVSAFLIAFSISVPIGGFLADRTGRRDSFIMTSFLSFIILMPVVPYLPPWAVVAVFVVVGILFGLGAGPVMSLPTEVLPPNARAFGMGVFYSVYFSMTMVAPAIAGKISDRMENVTATLFFGVFVLILAAISLGFFRRLHTGGKAAGIPPT